MSYRPRAWSIIDRAQLESYLREAELLARLAAVHNVTPFAAALAGVAFIRNALEVMGGQVEWWIEYVRSGALPRTWPYVPLSGHRGSS